VDLLDKSPTKDPDFQFPPLDERIDFYDELYTKFISLVELSDKAKGKISDYLTRLKNDAQSDSLEKMLKVQKLVRGITDMFDVNNLDTPEVYVATRMKGIESLSQILDVDMKRDLASWIDIKNSYYFETYLSDMKTYGELGDDAFFNADAIEKMLIAQESERQPSDNLSAWDNFFDARDARYIESQKQKNMSDRQIDNSAGKILEDDISSGAHKNNKEKL
jgi:hypothetical protein